MMFTARNCSIILIPLLIYSAALQNITGLLGNLRKCKANFTIAGIFRIHSEIVPGNFTCAHKPEELLHSGLFEALAFVFAAITVNANDSLLPGMPISIEILDSCGNINSAIHRYLGLDFVSDFYSGFENEKFRPGRVFSVVGSSTTAMARSLSTLSNVFEVPLISYVASSPVLSGCEQFRSFFRTVPSDELLIEAIIDFLFESNWTVISTVYARTDYALSAFQLFISQIKKKSVRKGNQPICIVSQYEVHNMNNITELDHLAEMIKNETSSKVIIVFAHEWQSYKILNSAYRKNVTEKAWILSDGTEELSDAECLDIGKKFPDKVILIDFKRQIYDEFFDFIFKNVYQSLSQELVDLLPLGVDEWNLISKSRHALNGEMVGYVDYVIDAVMAAAHALHITLNCTETACNHPATFQQSVVIENLLKVNFTSQSGREISFNIHGDTNGTYIFNVFSNNGTLCRFHELAEWQSSGNPRGFVFYNDSLAKTTVAKCIDHCPDGSGRDTDKPRRGCCWRCRKCRGNEFSSKATKKCEQCPDREAPDDRHSKCIPLKRQQRKLTESALNMVVLCFSVIGLFLVLFTSVIFFSHRRSHVVRASNKMVTAFLLFGISLGYVAPLIGILQSTIFTCRLYLYLNSISVGLMTGSLFTKANRMYRIFRKQAMTEGQLKFMGIQWQLLTVSFFVALEILLPTVLIFGQDKPLGIKDVISKSDKTIIVVCESGIDFWTMLGMLSVPQCLTLLCTYQAFLARKVPGEYNDSKAMFFVTMAMSLENTVLVVVFYYGALDYSITFTANLLSVLYATVIIVCLFGYKLYVILLKPDLNAVTLPHGNLGTFATPQLPPKTPESELGKENKAFDITETVL